MSLATFSRRARLHFCSIYTSRECASIAERLLLNRKAISYSIIKPSKIIKPFILEGSFKLLNIYVSAIKRFCRYIFFIILPICFFQKDYCSSFSSGSSSISSSNSTSSRYSSKASATSSYSSSSEMYPSSGSASGLLRMNS